jgi:cell fate regulator YaaT (PSP1 superfamily)
LKIASPEDKLDKVFYLVLVRFGKLAFRERFKTQDPHFRSGDLCIVKTERGKELGKVILPPEVMPEGLSPENFGELIRKATQEDLMFQEWIQTEQREKELASWRRCLEQEKLPIKLVEIDHLFGGEKVIFYFISEAKVDFRRLVSLLSQELGRRVELRQVGARDEAKLKWDYGPCGLPLCCKNFFIELGGITMEMVKLQKHTTDPAKITGRCGKLFCCFRYEAFMYQQADESLPREGMLVKLAEAEGVVVERNLLLGEFTILKPDGQKLKVKREESFEILS